MKRSILRKTLAAAALSAAFISSGCSSAATQVEQTPQDRENVGGDWILIELGGVAVEPATDGRKPSVSFADDGKANGFAGCNRFTGGYVAGDGKLKFSPLAATRMACTTGMDQEMRYLQGLDEVERYEIEAGSLSLFGTGKDALMKFEPRTGD